MKYRLNRAAMLGQSEEGILLQLRGETIAVPVDFKDEVLALRERGLEHHELDADFRDSLAELDYLVPEKTRGFFQPCPKTFLNAPEYRQGSRTKIGIVGVPYDLGTFSPYSNTGARFAPKDIRECSDAFGDYQSGIINLSTQEPLNFDICDFGDITLLTPYLNHSAAHQFLKGHATYVREQCDIPIFLGGDHSITQSLVNEDTSILIWFDAHTDFGEGERYLHNCVLREIASAQSIEKIICIGIRNFIPATDYERMIQTGKVEFVDIANLKSLESTLRQYRQSQVHVSIDMDCLDPSIAPDVGYPMPAGLTLHELTQALQFLVCNLSKISFDFVESYHVPIETSKANITSMNAVYSILSILSALSKS